ncbi:hypothetical protein M0811_04083 [Anaeramoeba ignava]|uniref:DH domain-containing protein n=1 Tax=Anaeramoeba ignava TaxID=1746090 RepID=A0A9Q0LXN4_ANAIG|nr:hypothetical protein M0811_04083 [Anaeramoeba ignava]
MSRSPIPTELKEDNTIPSINKEDKNKEYPVLPGLHLLKMHQQKQNEEQQKRIGLGANQTSKFLPLPDLKASPFEQFANQHYQNLQISGDGFLNQNQNKKKKGKNKSVDPLKKLMKQEEKKKKKQKKNKPNDLLSPQKTKKVMFAESKIPDELKVSSKLLFASFARPYLQVYLQEQFCLENFLFFQAAQEFSKILYEDELKNAAETIVQTFLSEKGKYELNVSSQIRSKILKIYETGEITSNLFDESIQYIQNLLNATLHNFMKTNYYEQMLKEWQEFEEGKNPKGPSTLRDKVFEELWQHEKKFSDSLSDFQTNVLKNLEDAIGNIISEEEYESFFGTFEKIFIFSRMLVGELNTKRANWHYYECVGDVFLKYHNQFAALYKKHTNEIEDIIQKVKLWMSSKNVLNFLKKSGTKKLDQIEKILRSPSTKLSDYDYFIRHFLHFTLENHPDYINLIEVQSKLKKLGHEIQQAKVINATLDLRTINIFNDMELVRMDIGKAVVYPSNPELNGKIVHLFLFQDHISWCFCFKDSQQFSLEYLAPLAATWISETVEENEKTKSNEFFSTKDMFKIKSPEKEITLQYAKKADFIHDFKRCLESSIAKLDNCKIIDENYRFLTYVFHDKTKYTGKFKCAMIHGEGELKYPNGSSFKGFFDEGKKSGTGTLTYSTGESLTGTWVNDLPNGNFVFKCNNFVRFDGIMVDGKKEGFGEYFFSNGAVYKGDFKENKFNGNGKLTFTDGSFYEGHFVENMHHGAGKFVVSHSFYQGDWFKNFRQGQGKQVYQNGDIYEGEWKDNLQHGIGTFVTKEGTYTGNWEKGMKQGNGTMIWNNKKKYEGDWNQNLRHGNGTLYNGKIKYTGQWVNDIPEGKGEFICYKNEPSEDDSEPEIVEKIVGHFKQGKPHGRIQQNKFDFYRYSGEMSLGKKQNKSMIVFENDNKLFAEFKDDKIDFEKEVTMELPFPDHLVLNYQPTGDYVLNRRVEKKGKNNFLTDSETNLKRIETSPDLWLFPSENSPIWDIIWF